MERCAAGVTDGLKVGVGLHQGFALSSVLFAVVMERLASVYTKMGTKQTLPTSLALLFHIFFTAPKWQKRATACQHGAPNLCSTNPGPSEPLESSL